MFILPDKGYIYPFLIHSPTSLGIYYLKLFFAFHLQHCIFFTERIYAFYILWSSPSGNFKPTNFIQQLSSTSVVSMILKGSAKNSS